MIPAARLAICAVVLFCATSASAADHARRTTLHRYTPFAAGVTLTDAGSGDCWTNSIASAREDAFRCMIGNGIYDPCFARTHTATFVLCPNGRPGAGVTRLNLTKKLPRTYPDADPTRHPPWVVRTSTGKWCGIFTGATGDVDGRQVSYGCAGGGLLLALPKRNKSSAWTIAYATSFKAKHFHSITLTAAWW